MWQQFQLIEIFVSLYLIIYNKKVSNKCLFSDQNKNIKNSIWKSSFFFFLLEKVVTQQQKKHHESRLTSIKHQALRLCQRLGGSKLSWSKSNWGWNQDSNLGGPKFFVQEFQKVGILILEANNDALLTLIFLIFLYFF